MTRRILFIVWFSLIANAAVCMQAGIRASCQRVFNLRSTPLTYCPKHAESLLKQVVHDEPWLNYRLALCKRLLNRDRDEVLSAAAIAAENDKTGIAQYFYGSLLQENHDAKAKMWLDKAAQNGIGWEEFIRDEQMQLNGLH